MTEMTDEQAAAAFNLWMDEYTNHPEDFEREWKTVMTFLEEKRDGRELSYGERCVKYLEHCHKRLTASGPSVPVPPPNRDVRDGSVPA